MSDGVNSTGDSSWAGRPWLARGLRLATFVLPIGLAFFVTYSLSRAMATPTSTAMAIAEGLLFVGIAFVVMAATERVVRLVAPITVLLRMTMVFPDRAPSRVRVAMRVSSTDELKRTLERVRRHGLGDDAGSAAETLMVLVAALSRHDRNTRGHSERVRAYADVIAGELGLTTEDRSKLRWAALLHDVGKMQIPSDILNKPGRLTEAEYEIVKQHPLLGADLAAPLLGFLGPWANAIAEHHERWDGNGYPFGLAGQEINYGARIVAVADTFDVITSLRSYKKPGTAAEAREEIARCAGTQFDPEVVKAFLRIGLGRFPWSVGPLSLLSQVPYLSTVMSPVSTGVSAVASAAAPAVVAAAIATGATAGDAWAEIDYLAHTDVPAVGGETTVPVITLAGGPVTPPDPTTTAVTEPGPTDPTDPAPTTLPTTAAPTTPPTWLTTTTPVTRSGPSSSAPATTTSGPPTTGPSTTTPTAPTTTTTAAPTTTTTTAPTTTTTAPANNAPDGPLPAIIGECLGRPGITAAEFRELSRAEFFDCDLRADGPLDLSGYNLAGSEIRGGNWNEADFSGADLTDAHFHDATMVRADFTGADLTNTLFDDDELTAATFAGATLHETDFVRANLNRSSFAGATLVKAKLEGASMTGADFTDTLVRDTNLKNLVANTARFDRSSFTSVDFGGSELTMVSFKSATFDDVKIDNGVIQWTDFDLAAMSKVDLGNSTGEATLGTGPWEDVTCPDGSNAVVRSCTWLS